MTKTIIVPARFGDFTTVADIYCRDDLIYTIDADGKVNAWKNIGAPFGEIIEEQL